MKTGLIGREVSAAAAHPLLLALQHAGVPLAQHRELQNIDWQDRQSRLSWDTCVRLLDLASEHLTPEQLEQIGSDGLWGHRFRLKARVATAVLVLEDAVRFIVAPTELDDFACLKAAVQCEPGAVHVSAFWLDGYAPHPAFTRIMVGAGRNLAAAFHLENAEVTGELDGRHLQIRIHYPVADGFRRRARQRLSSLAYRLLRQFSMQRTYEEFVSRTLALEQELMRRDQQLQLWQQQQTAHERRLNQLAEIIAEFDEHNRLIYISPNAERLLGYPRALMFENPMISVPPHLGRQTAEFLAAAREGAIEGLFEAEVRHADGRTLPYEVSVTRYQEPGDGQHWIVVLRQRTADQVRLLPQAHEPADTSEAAAAETPAANGGGVLLLVDDEAVVRSVAAHVFQRAGYEVVEADSAERAWSLLGNPDLRPLALILDLHLSDLSGDGLFRNIRQVHPRLPVLFVTGNPDEAPVDQPLTALVRKPYRAAELVDALAGLLATRAEPATVAE